MRLTMGLHAQPADYGVHFELERWMRAHDRSFCFLRRAPLSRRLADHDERRLTSWLPASISRARNRRAIRKAIDVLEEKLLDRPRPLA
jgi:hypothetical protein